MDWTSSNRRLCNRHIALSIASLSLSVSFRCSLLQGMLMNDMGTRVGIVCFSFWRFQIPCSCILHRCSSYKLEELVLLTPSQTPTKLITELPQKMCARTCNVMQRMNSLASICHRDKLLFKVICSFSIWHRWVKLIQRGTENLPKEASWNETYKELMTPRWVSWIPMNWMNIKMSKDFFSSPAHLRHLTSK